VPDRGKLPLSIDFGETRKMMTGTNFPGDVPTRQQLPDPVKFAGMR
jgi:hypothetical protein